MSKIQKLYRKIRNDPKAVSFQDLDKLLLFAGFKVRQPGSGSSHYFYKKNDKCISVPYKRPFLREHYVNKVIEFLEGELDIE